MTAIGYRIEVNHFGISGKNYDYRIIAPDGRKITCKTLLGAKFMIWCDARRTVAVTRANERMKKK